MGWQQGTDVTDKDGNHGKIMDGGKYSDGRVSVRTDGGKYEDWVAKDLVESDSGCFSIVLILFAFGTLLRFLFSCGDR